MQLKQIALTGLVIGCVAIPVGAANNKKPVTQWTCADFLAVEDIDVGVGDLVGMKADLFDQRGEVGRNISVGRQRLAQLGRGLAGSSQNGILDPCARRPVAIFHALEASTAGCPAGRGSLRRCGGGVARFRDGPFGHPERRGVQLAPTPGR